MSDKHVSLFEGNEVLYKIFIDKTTYKLCTVITLVDVPYSKSYIDLFGELVLLNAPQP